MRFTRYTRFVPGDADEVNLQALLGKLSGYLLDSGFVEGGWWGGDPGADRSADGLREALVEALIASGQLTPEMIRYLRGESSGDPARDADLEQQLADLLDALVGRLVSEGYLRAEQRPAAPTSVQPVLGPGGQAREAASTVQFELTDKTADLLGYQALRDLLGALGHASAGAHETPQLATGVESEAASRPWEYGDMLNLDVAATLRNAMIRQGTTLPLELDYPDLMVQQAAYRSSAATVLMLDCSHSMILYGEDRFTPAKRVALALTHLIRTQFPGDSVRAVLFHDSSEEIPLSALARVQVGPWHTNTAQGLKLARRILMSQRKEMRQIIMITDGKPSAMTLPNGQIYVNSLGLDPTVLQATFREVGECRRAGIVINTFMLARERSLVEFVRHVSAICRGKAYFTSTLTLGQYVLQDFLRRKTKKRS